MKNVLIIETEAEYAKTLENILEHVKDGINVLAILSSAEPLTQWLSSNTLPVLKNPSAYLKGSYKAVVLVPQKNKIIPLQVKDIACFYFNNNMLVITMLSNQKYNKKSVVNAEKFFARKLVITLGVDVPATIIISKARSTVFLKWLEGI